MDFKVLILGTDINAYTMARSYHELYNKNVDLIGKKEMLFTSTSKFCNIVYHEDLQEPEFFVKILREYALKNKDNKIILIGTNDHYINLIVKYESVLKKWYLFNYPTSKIANDFLDKSRFYKKYSKYFDMPKTFIYSCNKKELNTEDMLYPLIIKPGDGHAYYNLSFEGQNKVFKVNSEKELLSVIELIENAGYKETLIIQEFIPGDDSMLFDSMFYVNTSGKCENATFAQIALQEHTKTGVGNSTVLINGFNQFGDPTKLVKKLKNFLEEINYQGFAEFDFKYDVRDNKYKLFEINPRQARCSYYFSCAAKNLVSCLIDDLIYNKKSKFSFSKEIIVLSFVPLSVINKNIENEILLKEIKRAIQHKKLVNSLNYKKDNSIKRKYYLFMRGKNYKRKYANKNWW